MKPIRFATAASPPASKNPHTVFQIKTGISGCLLFMLALIVRWVYLREIQYTDAFPLLLGDAQLFDVWAREIAAGNWAGDQVFFNAPLYPYFLAGIYSVFGRDLMLIRLIQIGLGSLSCVWVMMAGKNLFSRPVGIMAGVLLAIYPTAVFSDCLIQKEVLALFLMAILLLLLSKGWHSTASGRAFWIGIVLGLLALVRENALVILATLIVAVALFHFREQKKNMTWILSCILGASLILVPVATRNWMIGKEFVLITANSGFNFYVGNHKHADGSYTPVIKGHGDWQDERQDAIRLAESASGRNLSSSEVSGYWFQKTLNEIHTDIPAWIRLMVKKWFLVWNSVEISDSESQYVAADESGLLSFLMIFLHFGVLGPLTVFGVALTWRQWKRLGVYPVIVITYMASIAIFFVFARFRYPVIPFMLPFAASGLVYGIEYMRKKSYVKLVMPVCMMGLAAVAMNWPIVSTKPYRSNTYYNIAVSLEKQEQADAAMANYLKALEIDPAQAMAHNNVGILLYRKNMGSDARVHFEKAIAINPDLSQPYYNLGIFWFHQGDMLRAQIHFTRAVSLNPDENPSAYYNLACVYSRRDDPEKSSEWLKKAIEKGYRNWKAIEMDPDLENLRRDDRYWNDIQLMMSKIAS
ncbi:MAG: tetratricopeptide repeat protein [Desulfatirhabdiaceae bacterium]